MKTICPRCMDDATIRVNMDDGDTCTCTHCDEDYSVDKVREMIASWGPLLKWLDAHPARQATHAARTPATV